MTGTGGGGAGAEGIVGVIFVFVGVMGKVNLGVSIVGGAATETTGITTCGTFLGTGCG